MANRRKMIAANWKMNGLLTSGLNLVKELVDRAEAAKPLSCDVILCPPATLIWPVAETLLGSPLFVGGQDCHYANHGAYTGNISAGMLSDLGCRYVILGHSERRTLDKETNDLIAKKVAAAQLAGLTTIVCVGETKEQRSSGQTETVITKQLLASLPDSLRTSQLVVAYEPVWAIGSGEVPSVANIIEVNQAIRDSLGPVGEMIRVLYGGSVTPKNADEIIGEDEIDGALVGGASLSDESFWGIVKAACRV
ncbi:MAG: triose-phosphate isomerase [Bdellovibrionales bacterium]